MCGLTWCTVLTHQNKNCEKREKKKGWGKEGLKCEKVNEGMLKKRQRKCNNESHNTASKNKTADFFFLDFNETLFVPKNAWLQGQWGGKVSVS